MTEKRYRRGVFAIVYQKDKLTEKASYLILKRKLHWKGWEFPKGAAEKNESLEQAVRREVREETGLKPVKIRRFRVSGRYGYSRRFKDRQGYIGQSYVLFSVRVSGGKIRLDKREHSAHVWLDFPEAIRKLKYKNQKKCLKIVNRVL